MGEGGVPGRARCLAGPVVAAAVILPVNFSHPILNDSKKLSEKQRFELKKVIMDSALAWAHGVVDHVEIDRINILNASIEAMHRAISLLKLKPEFSGKITPERESRVAHVR